MNIAVVGKFFEERSGLHIEEALIDMGHKVIRIDPEINFMQYDFMGGRGKSMARTFYSHFLDKVPAIRNMKVSSIYKEFEKDNIDLTIVLHDYFNRDEISRIKEITKSPIVLWFPDAFTNFKRSMFFIAGYDALFFVDKYIVEKLKSEFDLNTMFLPQACNPKIHKPTSIDSEKELAFYQCDITNACNFYSSRIALYRNLSGYNFKVWGARPPYWVNIPEINRMATGKSVYYQEKGKAFASAKIVLNNMHPAVINGVNKRMFEIPAYGAFQITSDRPVVHELFNVGQEIVTYKSLNDLKNKLDYFLINDKERESIRNAGYERILKDHTYELRLKKLINSI